MSDTDIVKLVDELRKEVRELRDREEIRAIVARYDRAIDRMDRDLLLSCYHPDAWDDHGTYKGDRDGFADYAFGMLETHFESTFYMTGTTLIELDGDIARCESYIFAPKVLKEKTPEGGGQMWIGAARFLDRMERRNGEWRIAYRTLVAEWDFITPRQTRPIGPYPYPPVFDGIETAKRDRSDASYRF